MKIRLIEEMDIPKNIKINPKATEEEIQSFMYGLYVMDYYTINSDGTIDMDTSLNMSGMSMSAKAFSTIPFYFNIIHGNFNISHNKLVSLEGSPQECYDFDCSYNLLTSLRGGPEKILGDFICSRNRLISLQYGPKSVRNDYNCMSNQLQTLKYCDLTEIQGTFDCTYNQLYSILGCPKTVGGKFFCFRNQIFFKKEYIMNHCKVKERNIINEN